MSLRSGISGFYNKADQGGLPEVKLKAFKEEIIPLMTMAGYQPCYFKEADITPNFHLGGFTKGQGVMVGVACNAIYPVVAFVEEPKEHECSLTFIDLKEPAEMIEKHTNFKVLTQKELNTKLSLAELKYLNKAELSQIKYWQPQTIGEIIFNWWD